MITVPQSIKERHKPVKSAKSALFKADGSLAQMVFPEQNKNLMGFNQLTAGITGPQNKKK